MTRLWEITKASVFFFRSETNTVCENIHPGAKYRKIKTSDEETGWGSMTPSFWEGEGGGFSLIFINISFCSEHSLIQTPFSQCCQQSFQFHFFYLTPLTHSQLYGNPSDFEEVFLFEYNSLNYLCYMYALCQVSIWFLRHVIFNFTRLIKFVDWELSLLSEGYLTLRENRKCYYG